jgi:hypothetical protein
MPRPPNPKYQIEQLFSWNSLKAAGFTGTKWSEIISAVREVIELGLCDDHWGDFGGGSLAAG